MIPPKYFLTKMRVKKEAFEIMMSRFDPITIVLICLAIGIKYLLDGGFWHLFLILIGILAVLIDLLFIRKPRNIFYFSLGLILLIMANLVLADSDIELTIQSTNFVNSVVNIDKIELGPVNSLQVFGKLKRSHASIGISLPVVMSVDSLDFAYCPGDVLEGSCKLEALNKKNSYDKYLITKGVSTRAVCKDLSLIGRVEGFNGLRFYLNNKVNDIVEEYLKPPLSSLLLGMLFGSDETMPNSFKRIMRDVGLTHIVVVSGYNLSLIYENVRKLMKNISRNLSYLIGGCALWFFIWIVGYEPPVLRAGFMVLTKIISNIAGRDVTPIRSLLLSSIILLVIFPYWIESLSFHLSFLATFAIINSDAFVPGFVEKTGKLGTFFKEYFFQSLSVIFFTFPYISAVFGRLSILAPLANLLVLPMVEDITILGILAIVLSFLSKGLGVLFFGIEWVMLFYIAGACDLLSKSSVQMDYKMPNLLCVFFYIFLLLFLFYLKWRKTIKDVYKITF